MTKTVKKIETTKAPKALGPYSQAISHGDYLFVSGQLPIDPVTGLLETGDIRVQTNRVLDNLFAILEAAGCDWKSVVRVEIFLKDLSHFKEVNEEYGKRFAHDTPPARQTIQVAKLPLDAPIEISCIAALS
jgi:2-iminobutanoate/2-iminopropanoate deaminase